MEKTRAVALDLAERSRTGALLKEHLPRAWRGSEADLRNRQVLAGENLSPSSSSDGPDPLLRIFCPRCAHDRCAWTIMQCVECKVWTDAHWADKISLG